MKTTQRARERKVLEGRARRRLLALVGMAMALAVVAAGSSRAATTTPVLWSAGGLDAGTTGAGQSARVASDPSGNVAVVSGPAVGRDLAVTSYTPDGALRWRRTSSPSIGTFTGDWVAAASNGDVVAVGHNVTSGGSPIAITLVRYASDGALRWRVDLARTAPAVGRLLVDSAGNAYLAFNSAGDGQDIQLHKYSPAGALLWSQVLATGFMANDVATSLALSPDETDVVLTGNIVGGATWITATYNAATGARRWLVTAAEGITTRDVVVDSTRVYVTGQGATGAGTPALAYWLTVVAYDRATGARLWRRDTKPADAGSAAGLRMALAPDGSVAVTGHAARGFLDWYTVVLEKSGTVRWQAVRDGGLNTDEIPRAVLALADGTVVVTGRGGPNLPGGFIQGVTVGYGSGGTLLWEAFARMETVWATALPGGDVCATGGYDALVTCWRPPVVTGSPPPPPVPPAAPTGLAATTLGRRSIGLNWANGATNQTEVRVERCTGLGCTTFVQIATLPGTATSYTDSGLANRTTYMYRVRAHNAAGDSAYSNTAGARTGK